MDAVKEHWNKDTGVSKKSTPTKCGRGEYTRLPVYVIPQEQVVALRREAAVLEQSQEVVVLTVDVA